ncbi:hypothetical protein ACROYT_G022792 [Oculina patagonica]
MPWSPWMPSRSPPSWSTWMLSHVSSTKVASIMVVEDAFPLSSHRGHDGCYPWSPSMRSPPPLSPPPWSPCMPSVFTSTVVAVDAFPGRLHRCRRCRLHRGGHVCLLWSPCMPSVVSSTVVAVYAFLCHFQAIRSTGCALAYKAHGCAVIGWFSTALIGAFRSSVFCMLVYCCSLGGPQSYSSPVIVFFDRGHPCFRNFNSTVPVDIIRVKSYVNRLFDPACVPVRVTINKLYLTPKRVVSGVVGMLCNGGSLGACESDVPVVFFDPILRRSSSLADVNFATFTGNPVNNAILLSRINTVFRPY